MEIPAADTGAVPRAPRPATVLVAGVLQIVAVVFLLGLVVLAWFARAQYDGWATQAARLVSAEPGEVQAEYTSNLVMAVFVSVLAGGAAIWLGATVWPLLRGSNVARILAAIAAFGIAGLGVLMTAGSVLLGFVFLGLFAAMPLDEPDVSDVPPDSVDFSSGSAFQDKLWDLQNGPAIGDVMPLLILVAMGLLGATAILLVLRPTNRWFNRRPAALRTGPQPVYYPVYYPVYVPVAAAPPVPPSAPPAPPSTQE